MRNCEYPVEGCLPHTFIHSFVPSNSYFNRDVECIRTFFRRRFNYESKLYPRFKSTLKEGDNTADEGFRLDVVVAASGFKKSDQKVLEEVGMSLLTVVCKALLILSFHTSTWRRFKGTKMRLWVPKIAMSMRRIAAVKKKRRLGRVIMNMKMRKQQQHHPVEISLMSLKTTVLG